MIVNLNFDLFSLDQETKIANAGELISGVLASQTKGDSIKILDWALSFYKGLSVTMDASDLIKLKEIVTNDVALTALAKAPILKYLETLK